METLVKVRRDIAYTALYTYVVSLEIRLTSALHMETLCRNPYYGDNGRAEKVAEQVGRLAGEYIAVRLECLELTSQSIGRPHSLEK